MTKKYTSMRIDKDTFNLLEERQKRITDKATQLIGKPVRITKIKVIRLSLKNPIYLMDNEIKKIVKNKVKL